jgi:thiol-disulfide isomerase/thioredoxin
MGRFLLLVFLLLPLPLTAAQPKVQLGDAPPAYIGKDSNGDELNLSGYQGKVVILTFWATWCAPCRKELPILNAIQKQAGDETIRVIAINFKEDRSQFHKVTETLSDWRVTFAYDPGGRVAKAYGVKSVPHMFMIGSRGRIANIYLGYDESKIEEIVQDVNALIRARARAMGSG